MEDQVVHEHSLRNKPVFTFYSIAQQLANLQHCSVNCFDRKLIMLRTSCCFIHSPPTITELLVNFIFTMISSQRART